MEQDGLGRIPCDWSWARLLVVGLVELVLGRHVLRLLRHAVQEVPGLALGGDVRENIKVCFHYMYFLLTPRACCIKYNDKGRRVRGVKVGIPPTIE